MVAPSIRDLVSVFLVQRIGPYHHARLSAWAAVRGSTVTVIEFRPHDPVYRWDPVFEHGPYARCQTRSRSELLHLLDELKPGIVVCVGYADTEIGQAMEWATRHRVPLVTCSDSTFDDEPRSWAKEKFKSSVVTLFDAALVAGGRARDYLGHLGLSRDRCFQPWDVVDNQHFQRGADSSRTHERAARARLNLPPRYFLCVARFVTKKNLERLIDAYHRYRQKAGNDAWSLVLSGAGLLEPLLRTRVAAAGLQSEVHFPGFLQYPDLPACYGLAGAFVLPSLSDQWGLVVNEAMAAGLPVLVSSKCGCAPELVREGKNGYTFEPHDIEGLAEQLTRMATLDDSQRTAMGRCSREIVAAFSPEAFAAGLETAIACALRQRPARRPRIGRVLISFLARRGNRVS